MEIEFYDILIQPGYFKAHYKDSEESHYIEFKLKDRIYLEEELIALSLSILCGKKYNKIFMPLNISEYVYDYIEDRTGANLTVNSSHKDSRITTENKSGVQILNFSGGFDSLAAMYLMTRCDHLVSMDFGKQFSRELMILNKFDTHLVKTNILETNFRKNNADFMFIGSILYSDYLQTGYNISGDILGAGPLRDSRNFKRQADKTIFNMKNIPYTLGLSEVAATRVAAHAFPELMSTSLSSLANPGEEKRYRKQLLLEIDIMRYNTGIEIEEKVDAPKRIHFKWGEQLLADHLSIYIMKYMGREVASQIMREIPDEAFEISQNKSLSFYDKYHPDAFENIPDEFKLDLKEKLEKAQVEIFSKEDLKEYEEVRNFMSKYHGLNL